MTLEKLPFGKFPYPPADGNAILKLLMNGRAKTLGQSEGPNQWQYLLLGCVGLRPTGQPVLVDYSDLTSEFGGLG